MLRRGGGLRRANQASVRAFRTGLVSFSSGDNLVIPGSVKAGDLATINVWGGVAPTGGSGDAWNSVSGYSGQKIWFRILRATDFVIPINVGAQSAPNYAVFYRGAQSLAGRVNGGGQGPPAARLLPGFVKDNACRGFISHNFGQRGVTYGTPSALPGFSSVAGAVISDAYLRLYERFDYQSYVDNYEMPFTIATGDPAQQRIHLFELLAY